MNVPTAMPFILRRCQDALTAIIKQLMRFKKFKKKIIDIDLIELARQEDLRKIKLCDAHLTSFDEVVDFQKAHKYKFMWVIRYCMQKKIPIPSKYRGMSKYVR